MERLSGMLILVGCFLLALAAASVGGRQLSTKEIVVGRIPRGMRRLGGRHRHDA